jgi:hypothetical protein
VSERSPHPTISDVALALATKRPSEPVSKVSLTRNAKGDTQIEVDVSHVDPAEAAKVAAALYDILGAQYPRENGNGAA